MRCAACQHEQLLDAVRVSPKMAPQTRLVPASVRGIAGWNRLALWPPVANDSSWPTAGTRHRQLSGGLMTMATPASASGRSRRAPDQRRADLLRTCRLPVPAVGHQQSYTNDRYFEFRPRLQVA